MGALLSTKKAGHDIVETHHENKTHYEVNTRHIYAKTSGFRLFDVHQEGSGDGIKHPGLFGLGIVGEILLLLIGVYALFRLARKLMAYRARHDSYKVFYRRQVEDSPLALPTPAGTTAIEMYPSITARANQDLARLKTEVKELKSARRTLEAHLTATGHTRPADKTEASDEIH